MESFATAPHHDVLVVVIQIAVLLFTARALGEVARRLGQPAVVGEILAGIVLGPSLLSGLFPFVEQWLIPQTETQGYMLDTIRLLGAMSLLLITGLEMDLALIRRQARTAVGISLGGILVPFSSGFLLGQLLPDFLLAPGAHRLIFSLFVAMAMSISAVAVIAKVLIDLKLMRRSIAQTIIAAAMIDDTISWVLLSVVVGLASGQAVNLGNVLGAVGAVLAFLLLSFTGGRWLVKKALDFVQDEVSSPDRLLTLVMVLTFTWAGLAQAINLESVLGAFVMGILFSLMPRLPGEVHRKLASMTFAIFAPIFFAVAGLKVNVINLLEPRLLGLTLLIIFIASMGKLLGGYAGGRLIGGHDHWTALTFGVGLNARGSQEIIIATIGLSAGILSQEMFSIIVLLAMTTSLLAPTSLRWTLKHVVPSEEEQQRLRQEKLTEASLVAKIHRVLLPVRRREDQAWELQIIEAHLLKTMSANTDLSITLLNVAESEGKVQGLEFLNRLRGLFASKDVTVKVLERGNPAEIILDEAQKDYDLLVLGAPERDSTSTVLFNPIVDYLMRSSPCPTMVVKGSLLANRWPPKRILVPINGTTAARNAAELGFALAARGQARVFIVHVVARDFINHRPGMNSRAVEQQMRIARQIVEEARELGDSQGVQIETDTRAGSSPEAVILDMAAEQDMDLIILGTALRTRSERLFLGPRVERILNKAPCPVVIINTS